MLNLPRNSENKFSLRPPQPSQVLESKPPLQQIENRDPKTREKDEVMIILKEMFYLLREYKNQNNEILKKISQNEDKLDQLNHRFDSLESLFQKSLEMQSRVAHEISFGEEVKQSLSCDPR